jgi:hypothetical protein
MKMIDPEKIFNLFNQADQDPPIQEKAEIAEQLLALKDTPAFKLGIFKKLILNHTNFNRSIINMLSRVSDELDMDDVKNAGEFIIYNRAWEYMRDLNVKDLETFESIKKGANQELVTAFKLAIHYFQETEEYERCAHLKKFCDVCEFFCN